MYTRRTQQNVQQSLRASPPRYAAKDKPEDGDVLLLHEVWSEIANLGDVTHQTHHVAQQLFFVWKLLFSTTQTHTTLHVHVQTH